ncbi:HAMP domain-containing histidine kinase [Candidatus Beckwithbacteria bacterium]|nr:HAMP domain-containing histidine kinase [Candidatus Beckwithbacteria bacterium]
MKLLEKLPIRTKLTAWYTISFMVVLAFSFISFYLVARNLILSKIDENLQAQADEITTLIKTQNLSPTSKDQVLETFEITKSNFVLVLNHNHDIVAQSQTLPVDPHLVSRLETEIKNNFEPKFLTEGKNRFYVQPLYEGARFIGTIIVGDSTEVVNEAFRVLLNTLILVFLIFMLPLILVSFLEADISLSPLRELAKSMNTISTKNLADRVEVGNPHDEIGEVGTSFNSLLDRLQKGFDKERQLIHDISHQLKTPLTAIKSDVEIALTKSRSLQAYQKILTNVLSDADRMSGILKDMMNFAWAASENQDQNFKTHNVSHLLEEAAEIAQQLGIDKHIIVSTSITPNLQVFGQQEKLLQIFLNILENAIKYSRRKGKILIQTNLEGSQVKIIIKDNGVGISKKDLPHIFERFYRGKSQVGEGSGLGLSIAAALTRAHKGTIEASSQKGKGTTFVITLPLKQIVKKVKKAKKIVKKKAKTRATNILPIELKRPHVRTFLKEKWGTWDQAQKMKKAS